LGAVKTVGTRVWPLFTTDYWITGLSSPIEMRRAC
jgi:hypothetical protein